MLVLLCRQGAQNRQGQQQPTGILKKPTESDSHPSKQVNLVGPLLENKR
jgi:metal transporter CNNM